MARVVGSPQRISAGRRLAALAVVGAFTIAACSSDSDSGSSAGDSSGSSSDKALVIARGMDVNSLDPSRAYCDTCQIYMTAVYETLIGLDDDNTTLVPRLATAWESNAEQTEFTFTLDPTAKFADGSAVTSADVKYSWERLAGLQGSASYLVGSIEAIDTPDDGTVKVTLSASNSAFLAQVNAGYLGIMNKKVAEANGATTDPTTDKAEEWFLANSAGSGPYTLKSYAAGAELRLERNDAYWGAAPAFPEVIIKETPQAVTQRQQLEEGSVDIAMQISNDVAAGMSGSDVVVEQVPSFNFVYLALSPGAAGGEELTPEVREAIRLALDYDGLVDATVGGAGQPQASPIPNGFAGTDGLAAPKQDLAKAQDLLTAAGVTTLTLDATYPSLNVYGVDFSPTPSTRTRPHRLQPVRAVLRHAGRLAVAGLDPRRPGAGTGRLAGPGPRRTGPGGSRRSVPGARQLDDRRPADHPGGEPQPVPGQSVRHQGHALQRLLQPRPGPAQPRMTRAALLSRAV